MEDTAWRGLFGGKGNVTPQGPPLPPGRRLELPGRGTTFVRDTGPRADAPTVFLLHGLSATGDLNWFPAFAPLSKRFRVVSIDHRGHGRGIRTSKRFTFNDCADDIVAAADELGLERFIPVGYSMGGPISQLVWRRHPERVEGLVLAATARNFRGKPLHRIWYQAALPGITLGLRAVPPEAWYPLGRRLMGTKPDQHPLRQWLVGEMRTMDPRVIFEAMMALGNFSSHTWLGDVDVPTASVITTKDRFIPPARQRKTAEQIPGATIFEVPADHAACVIGAGRFIPALVAACDSVADRLKTPTPV